MDTIEHLLSQERISYFCDITSPATCRICLEKSKNNKNIFIDPQPLYTIIMCCASVQICEGDGLPNTICEKCVSNLNNAWQFRQQCESSDKKLREMCYTNRIDKLDKNSLCSEQSDNKDNDKFEINEENDLLEKIAADINNMVKPEGNKTQKAKKPQKPKVDKIHQCETCGKIFHRREYLNQHIRIHTGEKPYGCHICDKRFINSGHLITHMRKHTGEKPHPCNLCSKAFCTKQELNKHLMVHKGERPFVCGACGKRFGSSSNLSSHFRHHTGEKNFACEFCIKMFYTKQELKQHLLVHTGEKPFVCEVCSKRFSQNAHLRRHLKLHESKSSVECPS